MLALVGAVVLATTPASADTRYERALADTNCRYETQYAKVQTPEQAASGQYTMKPTLVWTCDRVYVDRPYRHSHWYHAACPTLTVAGALTGGATLAGQAVVGAAATSCVFTYSHI